jgi:hypothetical protein
MGIERNKISGDSGIGLGTGRYIKNSFKFQVQSSRLNNSGFGLAIGFCYEIEPDRM